MMLLAIILILSDTLVQPSEGLETDEISIVRKPQEFHSPQNVHFAALRSFSSGAAASQNVFFIKRSNNKNEVHYDAKLKSNCTFDEKTPIDYYWHNLEAGEIKTHGEYQDILESEEEAYGLSTVRKSGTEVIINHKQLDHHPIRVRLNKKGNECIVSSTVQIHGKPAVIRSVYVQMTSTGLELDYIYILGTANGKKVYDVFDKPSFQSWFSGSSEHLDAPDSYWKSNAPRFGRH